MQQVFISNSFDIQFESLLTVKPVSKRMVKIRFKATEICSKKTH